MTATAGRTSAGTYWRAGALVVLVGASVLLQSGAVHGNGSFLIDTAGWLLVVLLPGYLVARCLLRAARLPFALWPPLAFTVGAALLLLPARLIPFTADGQRLLGNWSVGILLGGLAVALWVELRGPATGEGALRRGGIPRGEWPLLACALLAAGALLRLAASNVVERYSSEAWRQAAWITRGLAFGDAAGGVDPYQEGGRGGWLPLVALLARRSETDLLHSLSTHLPLLVLPLALLAFYGLAEELFRSRRVALFAVPLQAVFLVGTVDGGTGAGAAFFLRAAEPRTLGWLVVLPVALVFFLRNLRAPDPAGRAGFALAAAALGLLHPVALMYLAVALAGWAAFHLPARRVRGAAGAFSLALLLCVLLAGALWRPGAGATSAPAGPSRGRATPALLAAAGRRILPPRLSPEEAAREEFRRLGLGVMRPRLLTPLLLLAVAGLPILLGSLHRDVAAPFLLGASVLPALLALTPAGRPLIGPWLSLGEVRDLAWLIPAPLVVAYALARLGSAVRPFLPFSRGLAATARWDLLAPPAALALLLLVLRGEVAAGQAALEEARAGAVDPQERALLSFVRRELPPRAFVFTEPEFLPRLRTVLPSGEGWARPAGRGGAERMHPIFARFAKRGFFDHKICRFIALRKETVYLLLRTGDPWREHLDVFAPVFREVFRNEGWVIAKARPSFSRRALEKLLAAQREAVLRRPERTEGWAKLGDMHLGLGQRAQARQAYLRGAGSPGGYGPGTWGRIAAAATAVRDRDLALRAFEGARREGPVPAAGLVGLARVAKMAGDRAAERDFLERARSAAPWVLTAALHQELGELRLAQGEPAGAAEEFAVALRRESSSVDLPRRIARLLARVKERRGEYACLREAARRAPADPRVWAALGANAKARKDWPAAEEAWREAVLLRTREVRPYLELGQRYARRWETDKALEVMERAAAVAPGNAQVRTLLARVRRMREFERGGA